jgi:hypothetical protein
MEIWTYKRCVKLCLHAASTSEGGDAPGVTLWSGLTALQNSVVTVPSTVMGQDAKFGGLPHQ